MRKKNTTEVVYACGKCGIGHVKVFHTETENTRGVNINPCKNCKHQYGLKSLEEAALRVIYDSSVPASVPSLSERAVEERAIEKVINIVLNMNWDVMQNTIDAQELLSKLRELKTRPE